MTTVTVPVQKVEKVGNEWIGTCDHGHEVWTIHRATEYAAKRSVRAHGSEHTRVTPPGAPT